MRKLASCLTVTAALFADSEVFVKENDAIRCCHFVPALNPGEPLCPECNHAVILPAFAGVKLNECAFDVYGFGGFLYWQPHYQNTITVFEITPTTPINKIDEEDNVFGYRPAFTVGVGMVLSSFAHWIMNADYTWFHHGFSNHATASLGNFLNTGLGGSNASGNYSSILTKTHFGWDLINLNVQSDFYIGRNMTVNPFFGLKWFSRKTSVSQSLQRITIGTDYQRASQNHSGIGPEIGANIDWLWAWGFSMIGKIDLSILYEYTAKTTQYANLFGAPNTILTFEKSPKTIDLFAKGGLGIGWGQYLYCNRFHVNLAATYDINAIITPLTNSSDSGLLLGEDWWLEGLTLTGQFDF